MSLFPRSKRQCANTVVLIGLFVTAVFSNCVFPETLVYDLTIPQGHSPECLSLLRAGREEGGIVPIIVDYIREHDLENTADSAVLHLRLPKSRFNWVPTELASMIDIANVKYRFLTAYPLRFGNYDRYRLQRFNFLLNALQTQFTNRTLPVEKIGRQHRAGHFGSTVLNFHWSRSPRTGNLKVLVRAIFHQYNFNINRVLIAYRFRQKGRLVTRYLQTDKEGFAEGPLPRNVKKVKFDILGVPNFVHR